MSKLVFITGASGYLASHVIQELLEQGYRVRGSARGRKLEELRNAYASIPGIEFVEILDVADADFSTALEGVDAVIHTASPLPANSDSATMLKTAIQGSMNILCQAEAAGITKIVVTGSTASIYGDPTIKDNAIRAHHWNPVTEEEAKASGAPKFTTYSAAKKYAELAVWEWAESHPHVDVTVVIPPFLYGPFARPSIKPKPGDFAALSTMLVIYNLLFPEGELPARPGHVDIRDVARIHVAAINPPPTPVQGSKRLLVASPHGLVVKDIINLIHERRPELARRVTTRSPPAQSWDRYDVDYDRIEEVTRVTRQSFHTIEETFLDAIDDLLELEKDWKQAGYNVQAIPPFIA